MAMTVADTDGGPPSRVVGAKIPKGDVVKTITFDSSYPTGGLSLTPAMLGLASVDKFEANPAGGYVFGYDYAGNKVLVYRSGAASAVFAEETATTNLATLSTRVWARGNLA